MERIQISKTEKACKIIHFECPIKVSGSSLRLKNIPAEAHLHLKCPLAPQENMPKSMESEYLTKNHNLTFLMWNQIRNYKDLNSTKLQKIHNNWSTKAFSNLYTFSRIVNRFKERSRSSMRTGSVGPKGWRSNQTWQLTTLSSYHYLQK